VWLCAGTIVLNVGFYLRNVGEVNAWPYYHWLFSFADVGSLRRTLAGSLLAIFAAPPISYQLVSQISLSIGLILVILLSILSAVLLDRYWTSAVIWALVFGFLFAGFGLMNFGYMIGFLEQVNFIIAIFAFLALEAKRLADARFFIAGCIAASTIFVHESALFYQLPALTLYAYVKGQWRGVSLFLLSPLAGTVLLITNFTPNLNADRFAATIAAKGNLGIPLASGPITTPGFMLPQIWHAIWHLPHYWASYVFAIVFVSANAVFYCAILDCNKLVPTSGLGRGLVYLPILGPVTCLLLVGDLLRFLALIPTNLFLLVAFLFLQRSRIELPISPPPQRLMPILLIVVTSYLFFPTIGAFPHIPDKLKCILNIGAINGGIPAYRDLCLEQKIEYWAGHLSGKR
jgi:hypothetical protein